MGSEENLQLVQQADEGIESSHGKENVFLNGVNGSSKEKEGLKAKKCEDLYKDDSKLQPVGNLKDASGLLSNQSFHTNVSPYSGSMDMLPGIENPIEDLSNENFQAHETGKEKSTPASNIPQIPEYPQSIAILREIGTLHYESCALPEISDANADSQNIIPDASESHVCDSDHDYAQVKSYSCQECEISFRTESALLAHLRSHTIHKVLLCKHCGMQFHNQGSLVNLVYHLNNHIEERPFVCLHCNKRFEDENSCKNHEMLHSSKTPYICIVCDEVYAFKCDLVKHLRSHTGVDINVFPKKFACE